MPRLEKNYRQANKRQSVTVKAFAESPASFRAGDPYARPFTKKEARRVLTNLGIKEAEVLGTYLSGTPHQDYYEPQGRCQVIMARIFDREIHLYLRYCHRGRREGWRISKDFAVN